MELFLSSLNVVMPLFLMMLAGWFVRRFRWVSEKGLDDLNRLNVRLLLPVMLFSNIYQGDILHDMPADFLIFVVSAVILLFLLFMLLVPLLEKNRHRHSALVLGMYRPNTAVYGLPLAEGILGDSSAVAHVLIMVSIVILLTNLFAVMAVEIFKGEKLKPLALLLRSVKNPIIYGLVLGMLFQMVPFELPPMLASPIQSIAATATPIAFIVLGASFTLKACKKNIRHIAAATAVRLIAIPLLTLPLGLLLFGFRGAALVALICSFATPTAISTLPMVKAAGGDDELLGEIIVFATGFSMLTIFGFVYLFKFLGFF